MTHVTHASRGVRRLRHARPVTELVKQLRLQANASVTTRGKLEHLAASFVGEMYPIGTFPSWGFLLQKLQTMDEVSNTRMS
jgi:hypothetical protein